ncbi:MAG: hypothetical protein ACOY3P_15385 [Planctomycetota bacterium]
MLTQAIEAGRAVVTITADNADLKTKLEVSGGLIKKFAGEATTKFSAAGRGLDALIPTSFASRFLSAGAALGAATAAYRDFISVGRYVDLRGQTGASIELLSTLDYAAKQTGTSLETVTTAFRSMARVITMAGAGKQEGVFALEQLGLTFEHMSRLNPDLQFRRIADALNQVADPTEKAALAMRVFGESGSQLVPLIAQLNELEVSAKKVNAVIGTDMARAAKELDDTMTDLHEVLKSLGRDFMTEIGPGMRNVAKATTDYLATNNSPFTSPMARDLRRAAAIEAAALKPLPYSSLALHGTSWTWGRGPSTVDHSGQLAAGDAALAARAASRKPIIESIASDFVGLIEDATEREIASVRAKYAGLREKADSDAMRAWIAGEERRLTTAIRTQAQRKAAEEQKRDAAEAAERAAREAEAEAKQEAAEKARAAAERAARAEGGVAGTFRSSSLGGLGGGPFGRLEQNTKRAAEETAKSRKVLEAVREQMGRGGRFR